MRQSHHTNYQLLPAKVNEMKSEALTLDMEEVFDNDEKFIGFELPTTANI